MTFFGLWKFVGRLRGGRAQTHGGDHRASEPQEQDEQQRAGQQIEAYETAFRGRFVFSNGEEGGWIIADNKAVIDWGDL